MEKNFKNNSRFQLPCMSMDKIKINTAQPILIVKETGGEQSGTLPVASKEA